MSNYLKYEKNDYKLKGFTKKQVEKRPYTENRLFWITEKKIGLQ